MQKGQRLTKPADFLAARQAGRSWSSGRLVLIARPNGLDATRFGFAVGRRVGMAVHRNRLKRRLRAIARHSGVQKGWDLVLIARKDTASADFHELRRCVTDLLTRAGVVASSSQNTRTP